jgi:hypothetical protein
MRLDFDDDPVGRPSRLAIYVSMAILAVFFLVAAVSWYH